jgi:polar amino acid transport system permease protein
MSAAFKFEVVFTSLPIMLKGAGVTLGISLASIALGLVVGMLVCLCRISDRKLLSWPAAAFISVLRGVPILVLLLIVFYMLPLVGIEIPPLMAAILSMSLNSGAFQAEIYRGGFLSIPTGQAEAARALGMSEPRILWRILIPQVMHKVAPSLTNELIMLLKNSSLASSITVVELLRTSQQIVSNTYRPTELYLTAALLYILMSTGISVVSDTARRKFYHGGRVTA